MKVTCLHCGALFNIDGSRIPPGGANLKCAKCGQKFPVIPEAEAAPAPVPEVVNPPAPEHVSAPEPVAQDENQQWADDSNNQSYGEGYAGYEEAAPANDGSGEQMEAGYAADVSGYSDNYSDNAEGNDADGYLDNGLAYAADGQMYSDNGQMYSADGQGYDVNAQGYADPNGEYAYANVAEADLNGEYLAGNDGYDPNGGYGYDDGSMAAPADGYSVQADGYAADGQMYSDNGQGYLDNNDQGALGDDQAYSNDGQNYSDNGQGYYDYNAQGYSENGQGYVENYSEGYGETYSEEYAENAPNGGDAAVEADGMGDMAAPEAVPQVMEATEADDASALDAASDAFVGGDSEVVEDVACASVVDGAALDAVALPDLGAPAPETDVSAIPLSDGMADDSKGSDDSVALPDVSDDSAAFGAVEMDEASSSESALASEAALDAVALPDLGAPAPETDVNAIPLSDGMADDSKGSDDSVALPDLASSDSSSIPLSDGALDVAAAPSIPFLGDDPSSVSLPEPGFGLAPEVSDNAVAPVTSMDVPVALPDIGLSSEALFGGDDSAQPAVLDEAVPPPVPSALDLFPASEGLDENTTQTGSGESEDDVAEAFLKSIQKSVAPELAQAAQEAELASSEVASDDFESAPGIDFQENVEDVVSTPSEVSIADLFGEKAASDVLAGDAASDSRVSMSGSGAVAAAMADLDPVVSPGGIGGDASAQAPDDLAGNSMEDLLTYTSGDDASGPVPSFGESLALDLSGQEDDRKSPVVEVLDGDAFGAPEDNISGRGVIGDGSTYYIRRAGEKPKGPFDTVTVIYMINSGQLLGDEEISNDQDKWAPLNSVASFAAAMQQLLESPGDVAFAVANMKEKVVTPKDEALERAKIRYGGRIADIAIVTSVDPKEKYLGNKKIIAAVAAVLVILLLGGGLGFTSYGPFGVNWLFPKAIKKGSVEFSMYTQARSELLKGTWASTKDAMSIAQQLIAKDLSLIEPRAIYAQCAFRLKRVYGTDGAAQAQAERYLRDIASDKNQANNPEILKAQVELDLRNGVAGRKSALDKYVAKNGADLEARFLQAAMNIALGDFETGRTQLNDLAKAPDMGVRAFTELGRLELKVNVPEEKWVKVTSVEPLIGDPKEEAVDATEPAKDAPQKGEVTAPPVEKPQQPKVLSVSPAYFEAIKAFDRAIALNEAEACDAILAKGDIQTRQLMDRPHALETLSKLDPEERQSGLSDSDRGRWAFLKAQNFVATRQYKNAFAALDKALEFSGENPEIPGFYGTIRLNRGEGEAAEKLFAQARQLDGDNVMYLDGQLRALIAQEKYHPAKMMIRDANMEDPRLDFLHGRVLESLEEIDECLIYYTKAQADQNVGWEASLHLGNIYLKHKKMDEAKAAYEKSIEQGDSHAETHMGLGRYYLKTESPEDALNAFNAAIDRDSENASAHLGRAVSLVQLKQLEEAEKSFASAAQINEKLPSLQRYYGNLLWELGKLEPAHHAFSKANEQDYRDIEALWKKGALEFLLGHFDVAMTDLSNALASRPGITEALYYKGRTHYAKGDYAQAIMSIKSALEREKNNSEYHFWLGNSYHKANKVQEAVYEWKTALELNENHIGAMEALGNAYQHQGNFNVAAMYYEKALSVDGNRQDLYTNVAECRFSMARYEDAVRNYEKVLEFDEKNIEAHYRIAQAYTELRKADQAIQWYEKTLAIDPSNFESWKALGYVNKEKFKYPAAIRAFEQYLKAAKGAKGVTRRDLKIVEDELYDLKKLQ